MISKKTAERIWTAHNEIEKCQKLMTDMKAALAVKGSPELDDAFGCKQGLQLGIPSGDNAHRIFGVNPVLAVKIIEQHIEDGKKQLAELMALATIELKG